MKITKDNMQDVFHSKVRDYQEIEDEGYELIDQLFCDSSGLGRPDEPALTPDQLGKELQKILDEHKTVYVWITDVGQFQVWLSVFKK